VEISCKKGGAKFALHPLMHTLFDFTLAQDLAVFQIKEKAPYDHLG
jgi:hypothetical protein